MKLLLIETTVESSSTALPGNTAVAESSALKRKREGDEVDSKPGRKPRKQPRAAGGQIMPPPGSDVPAVDDDVQCGYYAIERFRATWQITHVSGILLKGEFDGQSGKSNAHLLFDS
jgi:hypothetical protein